MSEWRIGEILHLFGLVQFVQSPDFVQGSLNNRYQWQIEELRRGMLFYGEEYFKKERETFEDLPERYDILSVYDRYRRILNDSNNFNVNMGLAVRTTARAFAEGTLQAKWLKVCLPDGDAVLERMKAMHRENQQRLQEMRAREVSSEDK